MLDCNQAEVEVHFATGSMENIIIISTISDRSENRHNALSLPVHYLSPILFSTDQFPCPFWFSCSWDLFRSTAITWSQHEESAEKK